MTKKNNSLLPRTRGCFVTLLGAKEAYIDPAGIQSGIHRELKGLDGLERLDGWNRLKKGCGYVTVPVSFESTERDYREKYLEKEYISGEAGQPRNCSAAHIIYARYKAYNRRLFMSATMQLPEENVASRLVYHSLRTRFREGGLDRVFISHINEDEGSDLLSALKEDEPIYSFWITLPFPGGSYSLVFEEFADGSWAVFFEDFPSIIAGNNDSWEDALGSLVELVTDDIQDIIKNKNDPAVSIVLNYQKERHQFLQKVFSV